MTTVEPYNCALCHHVVVRRPHICLETARAQSQNFVYSTLHGEVVALRVEVERLVAELDDANDCIERQLSDLETLRAAHDGTSVDWRTR